MVLDFEKLGTSNKALWSDYDRIRNLVAASGFSTALFVTTTVEAAAIANAVADFGAGSSSLPYWARRHRVQQADCDFKQEQDCQAQQRLFFALEAVGLANDIETARVNLLG